MLSTSIVDADTPSDVTTSSSSLITAHLNSGGSGSNSPAHMRTPNAAAQSEADRERQRRREQERRRREVKSGQIDMNEQNNIMTTFEEMIE